MTQTKHYSKREEKANYLTHALGAVLALTATLVLVNRAFAFDDTNAVIAYAVFGFGMIACMVSSTLYHYEQEPKRKALLRHFDHASIYLQIAASYTPFTLVYMRNEKTWGLAIFILIWLSALIGIALNFRKLKTNNHLKTASYVFMGLLVLIAIKPLLNVAYSTQSHEVLYWLAAGGVFYITGSIFYALAKREFIHTVFHVFVLLGLICHCIAAYCIPLH